MNAKLPSRALQAIGELRSASETLARRPSEVEKCTARLLEATGHYWSKWFPAEPTAMDRAVLQLARAINSAQMQRETTVAGTDQAQQTTQQPE